MSSSEIRKSKRSATRLTFFAFYIIYATACATSRGAAEEKKIAECGNGVIEPGEVCDAAIPYGDECPRGWGVCKTCSKTCTAVLLNAPFESATLKDTRRVLVPVQTVVARESRKYDMQGNTVERTEMRRYGGNETELRDEYIYDENHDLIEEKHFSRGKENPFKRKMYERDERGNIVWERGNASHGRWATNIRRTFDAQNRVVSKISPGYNLTEIRERWEYDDNGNLRKHFKKKFEDRSSEEDLEGSFETHWTYDDACHVVEEVLYRREKLHKTYGATYNERGDMTEKIYTNGKGEFWRKETWSYSPHGALVTHRDKEGIETHYKYDDAGHVQSIVKDAKYKNRDLVTYETHEFTYNEHGDVTSQKSFDKSARMLRNTTVKTEYDDHRRITHSSSSTWDGLVPIGYKTQRYDEYGNIVSLEHQVLAYRPQFPKLTTAQEYVFDAAFVEDLLERAPWALIDEAKTTGCRPDVEMEW